MLKKVCGFFSALLLIILAVLAAALLGPHLFGCQSLAVLSGSMEPEIPVGSLVYVKEVDTDTLKNGDVVTYHLNGDTLVTHRVVKIDPQGKTVITKGDANDVEDGAPIAFEDIMGKVMFHLPYVGYISIYAKTPIGIAAICGVLILIILLTFIPEILETDDSEEGKADNIVKRKKERKRK